MPVKHISDIPVKEWLINAGSLVGNRSPLLTFVTMTTPDNYQVLLQKLDDFIRKYYKNQLIRGVLYAITGVLAFYLAVALLESFAWFGPAVRSVLFYLLIAV